MVGSLSCYACDGAQCKRSINVLRTCKGAIRCFKSTIAIDGAETNARGCIYNAHDNYRLCNDGVWADFVGDFSICCDEGFCNGGVLPQIVAPGWRIFAMIMSLVFVGIIIFMIVHFNYDRLEKVFCWARVVRRRNAKLAQQRIERAVSEVTNTNSPEESLNPSANSTRATSPQDSPSAYRLLNEQRAAPPTAQQQEGAAMELEEMSYPTAGPATAQRRSTSLQACRQPPTAQQQAGDGIVLSVSSDPIAELVTAQRRSPGIVVPNIPPAPADSPTGEKTAESQF